MNKNREEVYERLNNLISLTREPVILSFIYSPIHGFIEYDMKISEIGIDEIIIYAHYSNKKAMEKYVKKDNANAILLDKSLKAKGFGLENRLKDFTLCVQILEKDVISNRSPEEIIKVFNEGVIGNEKKYTQRLN